MIENPYVEVCVYPNPAELFHLDVPYSYYFTLYVYIICNKIIIHSKFLIITAMSKRRIYHGWKVIVFKNHDWFHCAVVIASDVMSIAGGNRWCRRSFVNCIIPFIQHLSSNDNPNYSRSCFLPRWWDAQKYYNLFRILPNTSATQYSDVGDFYFFSYVNLLS